MLLFYIIGCTLGASVDQTLVILLGILNEMILLEGSTLKVGISLCISSRVYRVSQRQLSWLL